MLDTPEFVRPDFSTENVESNLPFIIVCCFVPINAGLQGPISARLHTLCLGTAVGQLAGAEVLFLWELDEDVPRGNVSSFLVTPVFGMIYEGDEVGEFEGHPIKVRQNRMTDLAESKVSPKIGQMETRIAKVTKEKLN